MKKLIALLTALVMVTALALTGCGAEPSPVGTSSESNVTDDGKEQAGDVKLKFATFQSGDVAEDWETIQLPKYKEESGIEVEHVFVAHTDTITTYMTWQAAGTMPDIAMLSAEYLNSLISKEMILNLDKFTSENQSDYDFSRYFDNLLSAYKYNDEIYALPSDMDLGLMWYNKDIFDSANIDYPNADWTWEDLEKTATALTSGSGPNKIFGANLANYQTYLWQNETDIYSDDKTTCLMNTDSVKESLNYMYDMVDRGVAILPATEEPLFQNGKAAISLGAGPWFAHYEMKNVDFNWGVTSVPKGKVDATTCYGSTFAIFNDSEHPQESLDFITWFLTDEQQLQRAEQFSWFPPSKTVLAMDEFLDNDDIMSMTRDQKQLVLEETKSGKAPIIVENQNEINTVITREMSLMWAGEKTVDEATNQITKEVNELLK